MTMIQAQTTQYNNDTDTTRQAEDGSILSFFCLDAAVGEK
jgi:hypothetical protein